MVTTSDPYDEVIKLANEKRQLFGVRTGDVTLSKLRSIYRLEGIRIDYTHGKTKNLRAAYFNDDNGCAVLLNKQLPKPQRIFSLSHELKHHYLDQQKIGTGIYCSLDYNNEPITEKTAEVFAAEFVWPQDEFLPSAEKFGIGVGCQPEEIVKFKRWLNLPISYRFLQKRLTWFKFIEKDQYAKIKFMTLEKSMFGVPFYDRRR